MWPLVLKTQFAQKTRQGNSNIMKNQLNFEKKVSKQEQMIPSLIGVDKNGKKCLKAS